MPAGGGDPKRIGDGTTVKIRPNFSRGNIDIWDLRDIVVALIEERQELLAALAGAGTYGDFQTAAAALTARIELIDGLGS